MPVVRVDPTTLVRRCARCGAETSLPLADLSLTTTEGGGARVVLPLCEAARPGGGSCGTLESLQQTHDTAPPGLVPRVVDQQRRAVNWMVRELARRDGVAVQESPDMPAGPPPHVVEWPKPPADPPRGG